MAQLLGLNLRIVMRSLLVIQPPKGATSNSGNEKATAVKAISTVSETRSGRALQPRKKRMSFLSATRAQRTGRRAMDKSPHANTTGLSGL